VVTNTFAIPLAILLIVLCFTYFPYVRKDMFMVSIPSVPSIHVSPPPSHNYWTDKF